MIGSWMVRSSPESSKSSQERLGKKEMQLQWALWASAASPVPCWEASTSGIENLQQNMWEILLRWAGAHDLSHIWRWPISRCLPAVSQPKQRRIQRPSRRDLDHPKDAGCCGGVLSSCAPSWSDSTASYTTQARICYCSFGQHHLETRLH